MNKKILSMLLVFILVLSLSVPAFAAGYSDLNGHWAKEYMEDLAGKGYLTGYDDGTMRPDNNMTACETLALLSRFFDPGEDALKLIVADFSGTVTDTVLSSLSWAYDEIEICLAAGIITEIELKSMDLTAEIKKEQLSVFLVRAMQLQQEAEALSGTKLTFDDADDISKSCVGYIAKLVLLEIVNGDDENNISPKLSVNRAVVATMVSRALNYLETKGTKLVIEDYDGVTRTEGVVTSAGSSSLTVRGMDGLARVYSVSSSSSVTVNGTARSLSSAQVGCYATVTAKKGTVTVAALESDSTVTWVQGTIYSVYESGSVRHLFVTDLKSGDLTKYSVLSTAAITLDGSAAVFSSLTSGKFVTMKLTAGSVTEVIAVAADYEISGTISSISYGTTVLLEVTDADTAYGFYLVFSDLPAIYRGTTAITIERLSAGENVKVTVKGGEITSIVTEGSEDSVTGELTSITTTTSGTQWVIKKEDGTTSTYTIDANAGVYNGNTSILLSDIQAGDTVTVIVYNNIITEIHLDTSANASTKLSGTVLTVDVSNRVITVLTSSNKLVYVDVLSVVSIISGVTGESIGLYSIAVNSVLVAYGTYSSSTNFSAKSIIIEG